MKAKTMDTIPTVKALAEKFLQRAKTQAWGTGKTYDKAALEFICGAATLAEVTDARSWQST